jgi:hypothetical protein
MNRGIAGSLLLAAVFALVACGDDLVEPPDPDPETVVLSFQGLEPLSNGFHYEGWAIIDGAAVTTGKFNLDASGVLVDLDGAAIPGGAFQTGANLGNTSAIVITIEPAGDIDDDPAATHVLAGDVSSLAADLTVGAPQALADDFTTATGSYILATPTDAVEDNENSGIWFLSLATGNPAAGLSLPTLPDGWAYEGWAVIDGTPVTTGTFVSATGSDFAAPFSGPLAGPPFPGEDFLVNAPNGLEFPTDLAGMTGVISIEPSPDDSELPFTLKPLVGAIPADGSTGITYEAANNAGAFPTGTATIQ